MHMHRDPGRPSDGTTRRALLAASGSLVALLAACNPLAQRGEAQPKPSGSGKNVTLRLGLRVSAPNPAWDDLIEGTAAFQKKYSKITVEVTPSMNPQKFMAGAAAGDGWDVQETCCADIPTEARLGALLKLDPWIKKGFSAEEVRDWIDVQHKSYNIDGAQYGMGKFMGTTVLYYNKDRFRQKGVPLPDESWDWAKYQEAMVRLTDPTQAQWGAHLILGPDRRQAKVLQNGGHIVDPKDDLQSTLDHPATIEAFEWIHDRMWRDNAAIKPDEHPPDLNWRQWWLSMPQLFATGRIAMFEEGSWMLVSVAQRALPFEWDVVTLPRGRVQRSVLATSDGWAIWNGTKSAEDTWLLFAFFNSDDWYEIQTKRLQPARKSWLSKWISMTTAAVPQLKGKNLTAFTKSAEQGYAHPAEVHRYSAATSDLINGAYDRSVNFDQASIRATHLQLAKEVTELQRQEHARSGRGPT